ncbi:MAG: class I SAM-dependent methyltransferase [Planctomycetes bacterium]|nr:class I SAM-dependent methyltransferase [Planctomycetota bacterium]
MNAPPLVCPACDKPMAPGGSKSGFDLWWCAGCGMARADVRGREAEIAAAYREMTARQGSPGASAYVRDAAANRAKSERFAARVIARHGRPDRVLDVGAGYGFLTAAFARAGCVVTAVEPDGARAAAVRALGAGPRVRVVADFLSAAHVAEADPDLVLCQDVVEHLPDPAAVLGCFREAIRRPARFCIRVPNMASWGSRRMGAAWWFMSPPEHLSFFTPAALRGMLERLSHRVEEIATVAETGELTNVLAHLLKRIAGRAPPTDFGGGETGRQPVYFAPQARRSAVGRAARALLWPAAATLRPVMAAFMRGDNLHSVSVLEPAAAPAASASGAQARGARP